MKTKNKYDNIILKVQDVLLKELDRLADDSHMDINGKEEVVRSTAISQSANTIIKTIGLNMKIIKMANQTGNTIEDVNEILGITNE